MSGNSGRSRFHSSSVRAWRMWLRPSRREAGRDDRRRERPRHASRRRTGRPRVPQGLRRFAACRRGLAARLGARLLDAARQVLVDDAPLAVDPAPDVRGVLRRPERPAALLDLAPPGRGRPGEVAARLDAVDLDPVHHVTGEVRVDLAVPGGAVALEAGPARVRLGVVVVDEQLVAAARVEVLVAVEREALLPRREQLLPAREAVADGAHRGVAEVDLGRDGQVSVAGAMAVLLVGGGRARVGALARILFRAVLAVQDCLWR
jgi:hypothetical protein